MGADLYIKNMDKQYTGFEISDRAVNLGYFRDCYNDYGLFNFLRSNISNKDYSWWEIIEKKKLFDSNHDMSVKGAKVFLKSMTDAKDIINRIPPENLKLKIFDSSIKGKPVYKLLSIKDGKEFKAWLGLLIEFLKLAIRLKSPIIFSV